eukprot:g29.t1
MHQNESSSSLGSPDEAKPLRNRDEAQTISLTILPNAQTAQTTFHEIALANPLKAAIAARDGVTVGAILDAIENQEIPFEDAALMLKECLGELFACYKNRLKDMLSKNLLCWEVGAVKVPLDLFHNQRLHRWRTWTCNEPPEIYNSIGEIGQQALINIVRTKVLSNIRHQVGLELIDAKVMCFCVKDVCQPSLEGLIRQLLFRDVNRSIFKTELMKWAIVEKWNRCSPTSSVWSLCAQDMERCRRPIRALATISSTYGYFGYICYATFVGINSGKLTSMSLCEQVFLGLGLLLIVIFYGNLARYDSIRLKRYIEDYKELFHCKCGAAIYYLCKTSRNLVDAVHALFILILIPLAHCLTYLSDVIRPLFVIAVAVNVLFGLEKFRNTLEMYYQERGIDLFPIRPILRDLLRTGFAIFRVRALLILGVALSLYLLFNYEHSLDDRKEDKHDKECDEDSQFKTQIKASFGTFWRAMVTVFYASVGQFDPMVYFKSGFLSPLIITIFVIFVFIQVVVFLNVVIAWIGQRLDEYMNAIEETKLRELAKAIDAIEASFSKTELEEHKKTIGTYLYVLYAVEECTHEEEVIWQGRVRTVIENVRKMIKKSDKAMKERMDEVEKRMIRMEEKVDAFHQTSNDTLDKILAKLDLLEKHSS